MRFTKLPKLKYEGIEIGARVRAFDFEPAADRPDRFIEGTVRDTRTPAQMVASGLDPFACYLVEVDRDTLHEPGARPFVFVPFETTFDYDGRVVELGV